MAGMFSFHTREAVRVKVKKCEGLLQPEYRKFSVDPQITSFEVLQSLLARAFDIKGEFTISYMARDDTGQETYFSLLSDWDLDAAFLGASSPCLRLKVDLKPFEEGLEDWDVIAPLDFPFAQHQQGQATKDRSTLAGTILNQMEKTLNIFQKALSFVDHQGLSQSSVRPLKAPMNDAEFHNYLDSDGRLVRPDDMRLSIYCGGVEPGLRKVVWKHILNVYPEGLSGAERIDYMKRLSKEYYLLRDAWRREADSGSGVLNEDMQTVTNMVRKDVLRTDRTHRFYAGSDDNQNVVSLFNILTTFALHHPSVSYCQGMSDLASPLLVTMRDEAHAYVAFCALMKRLRPNFLLDGRAMTTKFQHLTEALQNYDPVFFEYLQRQGADDLLFCYRWLLLELKREFAFDDALRMLEVLWSSLPHSAPEGELELFEVAFSTGQPSLPQTEVTPQHRPKVPSKENPYTKVRAMRRQSSGSSSGSHRSGGPPMDGDQTRPAQRHPSPAPVIKQPSFQEADTPNQILPDYLPLTTPIIRELRIDLEGLNRQLPGRCHLFGRPEDLESPSGMSNGRGALTEEEEEEDDGPSSGGSSSDSEEPSTGESIRKMARRMRPGAAKELGPGSAKEVGPEGKLEEEDEDRHYGSKQQAKPTADSDDEAVLRLNGEILENDDDSDSDDVVFDASAPDICARYKSPPHLKGVVPIRLVRERSPRRVARPSAVGARNVLDGSTTSDESDDDHHLRVPRKASEGYATSDEVLVSSLEVPPPGDRCTSHEDGHRFADSGVAADGSPMTNSCEEALESVQYSLSSCGGSSGPGSFLTAPRPPPLPPPHELGHGNPFMVFLCLTLLLQHRDFIMKNRMDYNEIAMHFDKMVRRHHVVRVLHQARTLFADYMKEKSWSESDSSADSSFLESRDFNV